MLYRINRFGIAQTAKLAGMVYFGIGVLVIPFFYLAMGAAPQRAGAEPAAKLGPFALLMLPFFYGAVGYLMTALMLYIYNLAAKRFGGVELDIVYAVAPSDETNSNPTLDAPNR